MRQVFPRRPLFGQHRHLGWCGMLLLLASLLAPFGKVHATAACTEDGASPAAQGTITFNPPPTITLTAAPAVGTVLWTSGTISATPTPIYDCYGNVPYGLLNNVGNTPASGTYYPTGVAGLSYQVVRGGTVLNPWSTDTLAAGGNCTWHAGGGGYWNCTGGTTYSFSVSTQLSLVVTGPIANGSVLPAGTLGYWQFQSLNLNANATPPVQIIAFALGNSTTITFPTCSVTTSSIAVTLPTISTSALGSTGATAGTTPFAINLNCPSAAAGAPVYVLLNNNGTASGIQGVLTKTSGTSAGVGVQLLDSSYTPVTFGTPASVGTTPMGTMNIPYFAQYYRTAAVTAGTLTASATFTLLYQ